MWLGSVVIFILVVVGNASVPPENPFINKVLDAVEKGLDFFADDYSAINVDGLFGLRLGQGQLREAIRECNERSCDYNVLRKLVKLDEKLDIAANAALPYVESADPAYYERFLGTINKPYITPYEPTAFTEEQAVAIGHDSNYDEDRGDTCYARMLGTFVDQGSVLPKCNITKDCWNYMTQKEETSDYFITHQLLYSIVLDHMGCRDSVEKYVGGGQSIRDVQKKFCRKIYEEATRSSERGNVPAHKMDLFLEQTVLCGPLGFEDFMRPDWMEMVLGWPDKRLGCFKAKFDTLADLIGSENATKGPSRGRPGSNAASPGNMRSLQLEQMGGNTMRKLLREKAMKDGCLSHTSGLGFGVLCTYLRFLVRYTPMYMY